MSSHSASAFRHLLRVYGCFLGKEHIATCRDRQAHAQGQVPNLFQSLSAKFSRHMVLSRYGNIPPARMVCSTQTAIHPSLRCSKGNLCLPRLALPYLTIRLPQKLCSGKRGFCRAATPLNTFPCSGLFDTKMSQSPSCSVPKDCIIDMERSCYNAIKPHIVRRKEGDNW
jgi:hypothetical protein